MAVATTTLLVASIVTAAISAGVGAYSSVAAADARSDAAKFNAAVSRNNAMAAGQQAAYEAERIRDHNRRLAGSQRAALAKAGVAIDSGSASDLMFDSAVQGELDAAAAIYTGRVSAGAETSRAKLSSYQARSETTAGYIGAGSSILGGMGSALSIASNPSFRS